ncbi:MAG: ABC transporter substrate-binding protein, partial [Dehalococcoidales bacterium]|nr:ABC transporter substrate-binding protein [Dehalococcoidales bacterium]
MKRYLIPIIILLACILVITGCGQNATTPATSTSPKPTTSATSTTTMTGTSTIQPTTTATTTPVSGSSKYGGVLRLIEPSGPGTPIGWNPETSGGSVLSMQLSLQFLLKEMKGGKIEPNLAESYEVNTSLDAPSITFHLRKGVKFHDGTDFNAQAVKWNYEMTKAGGMSAGTTNYWKSIEAIDDYTLRVNFTTWQNRVIRSFADGVAYVCSPTAYEKMGLEWIRWHMVGTGPFKQVDFKRDTSLTTERWENYW